MAVFSDVNCMIHKLMPTKKIAYVKIVSMLFNSIQKNLLRSNLLNVKKEEKAHRLNMVLDLQSLFGLLCTAVLIG